MSELLTAFLRPLPEPAVYSDRLASEFALIEKNGFTRVFLQVQQIMEICKKLRIPHIIRGSAGSSLVCYLMGISHTDPIQYGMDLTRFMNHGRTDMPDIDIDVPYNRRDELYAEIGKTWPGKVARISNHVLYQYRSALQETLRELAPKATYNKRQQLDEMVRDPELAAQIRSALYEKIGTLRTESLHCGGIVIFDKEGAVPKELLLKDDGILPQIRLNKDETEDEGYIKIDVLSNRGIAQWWDASGGARTLLDYPPYDEAVVRLFSTGDTIGITFGESRGMRHIFRQLIPTKMEDIAIALALIRPAAAAGGRKAAFLGGFRTGATYKPLEQPIVYDDDALARIRAVIRYEGLPADMLDGLADQFRKAFAKQRVSEMLRFRDVARAQKLPEAVITRQIDDLNQLKHYSFCKSHALSYAQLVWALAFEKAHNPHAFWTATLNHCHSDYRRWVHWREARASGLLLTRGAPPFRLGERGGHPALIPRGGAQMVLLPDNHPAQQVRDMKERGYWLSGEFLPGCYRRVGPVKQRKIRARTSAGAGAKGTEKPLLEDPEYEVEFSGLIATGRVVYKETEGEESYETKKAITFICIGYDNHKFLDLVVQGARGGLLGYAAVRGIARTRHPDSEDSLDVVKIEGVPIKKLVEG